MLTDKVIVAIVTKDAIFGLLFLLSLCILKQVTIKYVILLTFAIIAAVCASIYNLNKSKEE
ncbi:hypothetical protein [Inconstantimicrobium mannanitabidum]|uniref:Uncharacterized protein n=1 Tax=Inconstantimicrobium mannanitabidum TaxID=1604901 RepID=A0ACB5RGY2_9CLOT|nr:hypothetical protein [Clostridium sp. TW13]GKX68288.1 hypothetical protein rsdtw13_35460 [Clostridium sp. TW13]